MAYILLLFWWTNKPGNEIINFYKNSNDSVKEQIKFMMNFQMNHLDNHVEYELLLSTFQDRALDFVTDFKPYHEKLGNSVTMTPHYLSWPCYGCDEEVKKEDCFGNGKYCATNYNDRQMKGTDILLSNIRQKCIFKNSKEKTNQDWWNYVTKAHSICYTNFTEDCSKLVHERLGLSWEETQKCVKESFINKDTVDEDNSILGEDYEYWVEGGFSYTPAIIINDAKYNGDMAPDYVFEAICSGFKDRPKVCQDALRNPATIDSSHVSFNWFAFVAIILVILNVILVAFCIRRNKVQLKTHVFSALGKY